MSHDDNRDLHTFLSFNRALVHPHTEDGYHWLGIKQDLGQIEADADGELYLDSEELPALIAAAEADGLTVEQTMDRLMVEGLIRVTNAPVRADGFGTQTVEALDVRGPRDERYRRVAIRPEHLEWQTARYQSGMWAACTEEQFAEWLAAGIV